MKLTAYVVVDKNDIACLYTVTSCQTKLGIQIYCGYLRRDPNNWDEDLSLSEALIDPLYSHREYMKYICE